MANVYCTLQNYQIAWWLAQTHSLASKTLQMRTKTQTALTLCKKSLRTSKNEMEVNHDKRNERQRESERERFEGCNIFSAFAFAIEFANVLFFVILTFLLYFFFRYIVCVVFPPLFGPEALCSCPASDCSDLVQNALNTRIIWRMQLQNEITINGWYQSKQRNDVRERKNTHLLHQFIFPSQYRHPIGIECVHHSECAASRY